MEEKNRIKPKSQLHLASFERGFEKMDKEAQRNLMNQPPAWWEHSNQDKDHINAISVGGGAQL